MERSFDVVVIGGGPAGYVCALRSAQLGKKVALVERDQVGGTCLNRGCVPMKALLSVAKTVNDVKKAARCGVWAEVSVDFERVASWTRHIVDRSKKGVEYLLNSRGVALVRGSAEFISRDAVMVSPSGDMLRARSFVVATGSRPYDLPDAKFDSKGVISSDEVFSLKQLPNRIIIVGGGVIGVEMATALAELGSKVVIVEIMDQLLPGWCPDVVKPVYDSLGKLGVDMRIGGRIVKLEAAGSAGYRAALSDGNLVESEFVLVAVGRRPNTDGLGLEEIGIELDRKGFVNVNGRLETSVPGVFAAGDVIGVPYLAHRASDHGYQVAEIISGKRKMFEQRSVPSVVYSDPEIAVVGLDEQEASKKGIEVVTGTFQLAALARALTMNRPEGFIKLVAEKESRRIIGAQIVGANASEIISACVLAVQSGMRLEEMASSVMPHPSLVESLMECAKMATGEPLHGTLESKK